MTRTKTLLAVVGTLSLLSAGVAVAAEEAMKCCCDKMAKPAVRDPNMPMPAPAAPPAPAR